MRGSSTLYSSALILIQTYRGLHALSQDTGSWPLRVNNSCLTGDWDCGTTHAPFHACCPSSTPCQIQYNDVCCPDQRVNCTETLMASGPRCADPTYNLCDNGGYFCCLPQQFCYSNGDSDGCAEAGHQLLPGQYFLPTLRQVQPSTTFGAGSTSKSSAASHSFTPAPSNKASSISSPPPFLSLPPSSSSPSSSSFPPSSSSPSSSSFPTSSSSSSGLTMSNRIDLGVPIGIGIPSLIVSFYLAWRKWKSGKRKEASPKE